jgi:sugar lactone lactonase YvrE
MRFYPVLAILLLACGTAFAGFAYVASFNGSNDLDSDHYHEFANPAGMLIVNGKLFVTDSNRGALYVFNGYVRERLVQSSGDGALASPLRMGYDGGKIYIADGNSGKVKTYAGSGSEINDWNVGSTVMEKPSGIAFGPGAAYITDSGRGRIYNYDLNTRIFNKVVVDNGGSDGQLASPADIEKHGGQFFVSDSAKGLVFAYDSNFTYQYTIGRGKGGVTLRSPRGIKAYQGRLYVADTNNNRVVVFTLDGYPTDILDSAVTNANLSYPEDVEVSDGRLYVADSFNKVVKVFNISQEAGNQSILQAIAAANSSAQDLYRLQESAMKLNLTVQNVSFDADIAQALNDYSNYQYSSASSAAQRISSSADTAKQALYQNMDVKIKQLLKQASDTVAPCRAKAGSDSVLAASVVEFDSKVSDANAKMAAKNYGPAAELALSLPSVAGSIKERFDLLQSQQTEAEKNRTVAALNLRLYDLSARLQALQAKASQYRQAINLSNANRLLSASNSSVASGDVEGANATLLLAEADIGSSEKSVSLKAADIDAALSNLSILEFEFNSSAAKPMLLPANLQPERTTLAQARDAVYSNPQLALAMAQEASGSAAAKVKEAQAVSIAAAALLVMVGLMAVIALAFFLHIRGRKRRGLQAGLGSVPKKK